LFAIRFPCGFLNLYVYFKSRILEFLTVELHIRVTWNNGFIVVLENGGDPREIRVGTKDDALRIISKELDSLSKAKDSCRDGWYIRVPPRRILDFLGFMVRSRIMNVNLGLRRYLESQGLNPSNMRIILPTLTALGLVNNGELTSESLQIGSSFVENDWDTLYGALLKVSLSNCFLRDIINKLTHGSSDLESLVKASGLRRWDEVRYTAELLKMITRSSYYTCMRYMERLRDYLNNHNCLDLVEIPTQCINHALTLIYDHLVRSKNPQLVDILDDVGFAANPQLLMPRVVKDHVELFMGERPVGLLLGGFVATGDTNYALRVRSLVEHLSNACIVGMRERGMELCMVIIPIVAQCPRLRLYILARSRSLSASGIIDA